MSAEAIVWIDAPAENRYERIVKRSRVDEGSVTYGQFLAGQELDMELVGKGVDGNYQEHIRSLADFRIYDDYATLGEYQEFLASFFTESPGDGARKNIE